MTLSGEIPFRSVKFRSLKILGHKFLDYGLCKVVEGKQIETFKLLSNNPKKDSSKMIFNYVTISLLHTGLELGI